MINNFSANSCSNMEAKKVVVQGGGKNLFKVGISSGYFYVYKVDVGPLGDRLISIGETRNLEDALSIIRSYSGREIEKISSW